MSRRRVNPPQSAPCEPTATNKETENDEDDEDIFVPGSWLLAMFLEMSLASQAAPPRWHKEVRNSSAGDKPWLLPAPPGSSRSPLDSGTD